MVSAHPSYVSAWTRLQTTWFMRIYTKYFMQYPIGRRVFDWIWRNGYPIYVTINPFNRREKKWRKLSKLSAFTKKRGLSTYKLVDAAHVETPIPKVYPACDQNYLVSPHDRYNFPEIFVTFISSATIYGRTNLVFADGEVVCHDLYDFERDYTCEELHGRTVVDHKRKRIRSLYHDEERERISVAAAFVDANATNYAHWLTEVLTRVSAFCSDERFKNIPIVVDDRLHKNIMESLLLVAGPEREVITLSPGKALFVDTLYVTSVAGYVPFERRTNKISGHSHGLFSPQAFELINRQLALQAERLLYQDSPEKIYLKRSSGVRKIINSAELEEFLVAHGYLIVEPEKLSFLQQVQLFNNAKYIIAPTGAALANAIFCKPGTYVAILMSKHKNMVYRYWCNMLNPIKINTSYVLGNIPKKGDGFHGDFFVSIDCFTALLKFLDSK